MNIATTDWFMNIAMLDWLDIVLIVIGSVVACVAMAILIGTVSAIFMRKMERELASAMAAHKECTERTEEQSSERGN